MCVCKYLKQRVRRIREYKAKSFKGVSKPKRKKKKKEIEVHNNPIQDWVFTTAYRL